MLVKVGRALGLGAGAVLGSGLTYSLYQSEGDISNIGAVRFGRAAVAVGRIAVDYKRTLSSQFLSEESYEEAKSECHLRSAKHLLKLCLTTEECLSRSVSTLGLWTIYYRRSMSTP